AGGRPRSSVVGTYPLVFASAFAPLGGLPIGAFVTYLPKQLHVATETLETCGAQGRGNLPGKAGLRFVARAAHGFRHRREEQLLIRDVTRLLLFDNAVCAAHGRQRDYRQPNDERRRLSQVNTSVAHCQFSYREILLNEPAATPARNLSWVVRDERFLER